MESTAAGGQQCPARSDDIRRVLGDLDDGTLLAIMTLRPTVADIEDASTWLAGDADIFGPGQPLSDIAGEMVPILTAGEDEDPGQPK